MLFDQGKLEKMTILALEPNTTPGEPTQLPTDSDNGEKAKYVVQVNPNSYTLNHRLAYSNLQAPGTSAREAVFANTVPSTLEFEFLFDGTGVVPPPSETGGIPLVGAIASALSESNEFVVTDEIQKFTDVVYTLDGKIHRPRKVLLCWGRFTFSCALTSLNYQFTLFKPDGTPLRALAKCSFLESISDCERERRENKRSPDLTHIREVREGDTLPLMAHRIYGDPKYYLEVARVNKLINFRRLRAGRQITLPPLAKEPR